MPDDVNPTDLVALRLPTGPGWSGIVADLWRSGAALLPVDARLPPAEADTLLARARPTVVVDENSTHRVAGEGVHPDVALVMATSGTAGEPKLVQLTRSAVEAAVAGSATALGAQPDDRWLCCLPLAHVGGLLVLLRSVVLGAPVTVHPRFDPVAIGRSDAAFVSLVPTQVLRLLDAGVDLRRFRGILVGGAAFRGTLAARAKGADAQVIPTYGLTESCGGVVYRGRPFDGTEMRIDPRDEVLLRGPTLMVGYRFDPRATAGVLTKDGWLRTGDAGRIDEDGTLRLEGRLDDLIVSGGEKVWPAEVEAALRDHTQIADAAVAGRPDPEWGQRVVAFVVPTDPTQPPTLDDLRGLVADRLARYKAPRELVLMEEIPRTASDKIRRSALP